jgi:DNA-binding CsgD family transcriptional regulator
MALLTPNLRTTIRMLIDGLTRKEIAAKRGLSHSYVRTQTYHAQKRLGCRTPEQMMYVLGRERGERRSG